MSAGGITETITTNTATAERGCVGKITVRMTGTFGGGSAQVRLTDPGGTKRDEQTALTVAGTVVIDAPPHCQNVVDVDLTGATTPTLNVWVQSELDR